MTAGTYHVSWFEQGSDTVLKYTVETLAYGPFEAGEVVREAHGLARNTDLFIVSAPLSIRARKRVAAAPEWVQADPGKDHA